MYEILTTEVKWVTQCWNDAYFIGGLRLRDLLSDIFVKMNIGKPFLALKPWRLMNGDGSHVEKHVAVRYGAKMQ